MANPIKLPWMNHTWGAPNGHPEVQGLPVLLTRPEKPLDGPALPLQSLSVWTLNDKEVASILATRCVGLQIWGVPPPVAICALLTQEPPETAGFMVRWGQAADFPAQYAATLSDAMALLLVAFLNGTDQASIRVAESGEIPHQNPGPMGDQQ